MIGNLKNSFLKKLSNFIIIVNYYQKSFWENHYAVKRGR